MKNKKKTTKIQKKPFDKTGKYQKMAKTPKSGQKNTKKKGGKKKCV